MSGGFGETLDMRRRASRAQRAAIVGVYAIAACVCAVMALGRPWLAGVVVAIVAAGWLAWRRSFLRAPHSIQRLRWHADGNWAWQTADGHWHAGQCVGHTMLATRLVVLVVKPRGARRRAYCVLWADSLADATHRRLRAGLTVAAAAMPPGRPPF